MRRIEKKSKRQKKKKREENEAGKKARVDSIQSEQDRDMRVHEMASGVGSSRLPIVDIEGHDVVPPTIVDDSIPVVYVIGAKKSGTQPQGPPTDVAEPAP